MKGVRTWWGWEHVWFSPIWNSLWILCLYFRTHFHNNLIIFIVIFVIIMVLISIQYSSPLHKEKGSLVAGVWQAIRPGAHYRESVLVLTGENLSWCTLERIRPGAHPEIPHSLPRPYLSPTPTSHFFLPKTSFSFFPTLRIDRARLIEQLNALEVFKGWFTKLATRSYMN